ncbi:uncharacterized protein VP01_1224g1 [Puccinia sorghi]|uniref:Uncharacterized protein n=1 Tax=Puccinia sorghi TaxID=27349 RepID=A0A0L6VPY5_9BASI|nr:uncharacterized protein VP01_1224g1 [Puccinia sorghi]
MSKVLGGTAANKAAAESNKPGGFTAGAIGRGPDLSQHLEELSARIEECSKGQRREFLKMKKRLDSMLSQNWSEGAQLRSEMMELTTALKAVETKSDSTTVLVKNHGQLGGAFC